MVFLHAVSELVRELLGPELAAELAVEELLTTPPRPEMGDLAFPCFPLAKRLRQAPPAIAAELPAGPAPGGWSRASRPRDRT